ncbi:MAG: hypothetical protein N3A62_04430 [Thermodesulfovibrionales bacterium]|nr:hypothetical protein [Thermodesulfovibrionales bacterium]
MLYIVVILAFLPFALAINSSAEIVCRKDAFGDTVCKDRKSGNEWRQRTDAFGRETWRDRDGNTYESKTDAFGNKTYKDRKGNTYYEKTDAFGNTIIKDQKGKDILKCSTNAFGEYVCR